MPMNKKSSKVVLTADIKDSILRFKERNPLVENRKLFEFLKIHHPQVHLKNVIKWTQSHSWITEVNGTPWTQKKTMASAKTSSQKRITAPRKTSLQSKRPRLMSSTDSSDSISKSDLDQSLFGSLTSKEGSIDLAAISNGNKTGSKNPNSKSASTVSNRSLTRSLTRRTGGIADAQGSSAPSTAATTSASLSRKIQNNEQILETTSSMTNVLISKPRTSPRLDPNNQDGVLQKKKPPPNPDHSYAKVRKQRPRPNSFPDLQNPVGGPLYLPYPPNPHVDILNLPDHNRKDPSIQPLTIPLSSSKEPQQSTQGTQAKRSMNLDKTQGSQSTAPSEVEVIDVLLSQTPGDNSSPGLQNSVSTSTDVTTPRNNVPAPACCPPPTKKGPCASTNLLKNDQPSSDEKEKLGKISSAMGCIQEIGSVLRSDKKLRAKLVPLKEIFQSFCKAQSDLLFPSGSDDNEETLQ